MEFENVGELKEFLSRFDDETPIFHFSDPEGNFISGLNVESEECISSKDEYVLLFQSNEEDEEETLARLVDETYEE